MKSVLRESILVNIWQFIIVTSLSHQWVCVYSHQWVCVCSHQWVCVYSHQWVCVCIVCTSVVREGMNISTPSTMPTDKAKPPMPKQFHFLQHCLLLMKFTKSHCFRTPGSKHIFSPSYSIILKFTGVKSVSRRGYKIYHWVHCEVGGPCECGSHLDLAWFSLPGHTRPNKLTPGIVWYKCTGVISANMR